MHPDLAFEQKTIAPAELPPLISTIEDFMRQVERLTKEAAEEHWPAFVAQMREKFGAENIAFDEPYLPKTQAYSSLLFLIQLEKLIKKLERSAEDEDFRTSIFDFDEPLMPQLRQRLELEGVRHQIRAKQELDKARQQQFGVQKYVWRASDTACPICAPLDGLIFSWGDGDAPGETHPNCQCYAEPIPDGSDIDDPPIEPVYPLETLLAILVGAGTAWKIGQEIIKKTEEPAPTQPKPQEKPPEKPQEILNPQNNPIGRPGDKARVREMDGGAKGARELYDKLSKGGTPEKPPGYPGEGTRLPNGDWVGHRPTSKSGPPTVDVDVGGVPFTKIKFPE